MNNSFLVTGSIAFDTIMTFDGRFSEHIKPDKVHVLNVSFTADTCTVRDGGTGGNIAYNLALLAEKPFLLASVGNDFAQYRKKLVSLGIDCSLIEVVEDEHTASAHIITDTADNQITAFHGGAMVKHHGKGIPKDIRSSFDWTILAPDATSRMVKHGMELRDTKATYIFDPGQSLPGQESTDLKDLVAGAAITIVNDYEFELLREKMGLTEQQLLESCDIFIVTLGEKGSYAIDADGNRTDVSIAPVSSAVDPTGAGDAYRAGLLKGLADNETLERSMQMGATCASFAVEHAGTQEHSFTTDEFESRLDIAFTS